MLKEVRVTSRHLQQIIGKLLWANTVVRPGRAFLRRLIDAIRTLKHPFAAVTLTADMRADLNTWQQFLAKYNGNSFFFLTKTMTSPQLHFYTDASFKAGAGYLGKRWFCIHYPQDWKHYGITFLELFPIVAALFIFGQKLTNHKIQFHTDNAAAVTIINLQTSRSPKIMKLVRQMVLVALRCNILFSAAHIPGLENSKADALSRLQVTQVQLLQLGMNLRPEIVPQNMLPANWMGD